MHTPLCFYRVCSQSEKMVYTNTNTLTYSFTNTHTHTYNRFHTCRGPHTVMHRLTDPHTHTHTPSCYLIRDHTDGGYVVHVMQPARGSAKAHVSVEMERWMTRPLSSSVLFRTLSFLFIHVSSCHLWVFLSCFSFLVHKLFCFYPPSYLTRLHFT